jgi:Skp family chaperone for outer membrane proteins
MSARRAAVTLLLLAALLATGCAGPRVGVVESRRVLRESVLALSYQRQLDEREKAMAADLQLLAGRLSREDLEARRQSYLNELAELKQSLEADLNTRIREAVREVARRRRLRIVLVKESVNIGGIDVTDDVVARLK